MHLNRDQLWPKTSIVSVSVATVNSVTFVECMKAPNVDQAILPWKYVANGVFANRFLVCVNTFPSCVSLIKNVCCTRKAHDIGYISMF